MPSKRQVRQLLERGLDYRAIGRRLGIPAGQAHLIGTGVPADGSDTVTEADRERSGAQVASQNLVNPPAENPTTSESVLRWIESQVAADPQLREATQQRDAVPGEVIAPDEGDAIVVLTRDHNQVKAMLKQLKTVPGLTEGGLPEQMSARGSIVDMITVALSKHEAIEEEHFWPAVRRALPDGDQWADGALEQEQQGKETLAALGKHAPDTEKFDELVSTLMPMLHQHVAYEEHLFLQLREAISADDLDELGETLRRAKKNAPTRPHPHAPQQPGAAVQAAGASAAPLDKARDKARKRPAHRRGKAEKNTGKNTGKNAEQDTEQ